MASRTKNFSTPFWTAKFRITQRKEHFLYVSKINENVQFHDGAMRHFSRLEKVHFRWRPFQSHFNLQHCMSSYLHRPKRANVDFPDVGVCWWLSTTDATASNAVKSKRNDFQLSFVAHERLCYLSSPYEQEICQSRIIVSAERISSVNSSLITNITGERRSHRDWEITFAKEDVTKNCKRGSTTGPHISTQSIIQCQERKPIIFTGISKQFVKPGN